MNLAIYRKACGEAVELKMDRAASSTTLVGRILEELACGF